MAYQQRLSGPILDRIDIHVNVPEVRAESSALFVRLAGGQAGQQTQRMRQRVSHARDLALARNAQFGIEFNRDLSAAQLLEASGLSASGFAKIVDEVVPRSASTRSVLRCLRVARTIADLENRPVVERTDVETAWGWQAEAAARARGDMARGLS